MAFVRAILFSMDADLPKTYKLRRGVCGKKCDPGARTAMKIPCLATLSAPKGDMPIPGGNYLRSCPYLPALICVQLQSRGTSRDSILCKRKR